MYFLIVTAILGLSFSFHPTYTLVSDLEFSEIKDRTFESSDSTRSVVQRLIIESRFEEASKLLNDTPRDQKDLEFYQLVSQVTLALQQYDFAIEALQIARGFNPDDLNLIFQLARTYRIAGQTELAESLAETIITRDQNHRQAMILYGGIQLEKQNWTLASRTYLELVSLDSTNTFFRYQLAQALDRLEDRGLALIHLREAHRLSPKHHGVLHDLIQINAQLGLNEIAREYAEKAILMSPNFIPFRKRLAEIEFREQNYVAAAEHYQEVIQLGERTEFNWRNLGMSLYFSDQFESAVRAFDNALTSGDDPNAHFYKAMSLNQLGRTDEAISHLNLASDNSMGNLLIDSYIQKGSLFDRKGDIDASISNYDIALKLSPHRIEINFYMASAYDRTGNNKTQARDLFRKYLFAEVSRDPTMENYARSRLSSLTEEIHFRGN